MDNFNKNPYYQTSQNNISHSSHSQNNFWYDDFVSSNGNYPFNQFESNRQPVSIVGDLFPNSQQHQIPLNRFPPMQIQQTNYQQPFFYKDQLPIHQNHQSIPQPSQQIQRSLLSSPSVALNKPTRPSNSRPLQQNLFTPIPQFNNILSSSLPFTSTATKNPTIPEISNPHLQPISSNVSTSEVKRGRGRPRKVIPGRKAARNSSSFSDSDGSDHDCPKQTHTKTRKPKEREEVAESASAASRRLRHGGTNVSAFTSGAEGVSEKREEMPGITAKDGVTYRVDGMSEVPQDTYYIGRILEFVLIANAPVESARIGWFYRPKDILLTGEKRKNWDPRLLIASMHSDKTPISSIRGKCNVNHSHFISNLDKYKSTDDSFHYKQLYDRYTHRIYDVVPLALVKHLPSATIKWLSKYTFIIVEAGAAFEFTEKRSLCSVCDLWCMPGQSVRCGACWESFHLACGGLAKKPKKGVEWICEACEKKKDDGVVEEPIKEMKPLWPYIYMGDFSRVSDLTGEGNPKASSRVGFDFQAEIPNLFSADNPEPEQVAKPDDPEVLTSDNDEEDEDTPSEFTFIDQTQPDLQSEIEEKS
ncbi:putative PHD type zinc finger protein with BAH domain-containing protein, partial [Nowakowskiella sp. JEL0078]